mmetsp:Transcript_34256/g.74328  ORF Transcript_34256/g.74328 Transcript_34256/m.74328 type:complete len:1127 (-) Transcript_34256:344-3724(-)
MASAVSPSSVGSPTDGGGRSGGDGGGDGSGSVMSVRERIRLMNSRDTASVASGSRNASNKEPRPSPSASGAVAVSAAPSATINAGSSDSNDNNNSNSKPLDDNTPSGGNTTATTNNIINSNNNDDPRHDGNNNHHDDAGSTCSRASNRSFLTAGSRRTITSDASWIGRAALASYQKKMRRKEGDVTLQEEQEQQQEQQQLRSSGGGDGGQEGGTSSGADIGSVPTSIRIQELREDGIGGEGDNDNRYNSNAAANQTDKDVIVEDYYGSNADVSAPAQAAQTAQSPTTTEVEEAAATSAAGSTTTVPSAATAAATATAPGTDNESIRSSSGGFGGTRISGRPGKLKVPPAFLGGSGGGVDIGGVGVRSSPMGSEVLSPLTAASSTGGGTGRFSTPTANDGAGGGSSSDRRTKQATESSPPDAVSPSSTTAALPSRTSPSEPMNKPSAAQVLADTASGAASVTSAASSAKSWNPSPSLAHAEERKKVQEKRRKMKRRIQANQMQHQAQQEAARRAQQKEVTEIISPANDGPGGVTSPGVSAILPAGEASIECILNPTIEGTAAVAASVPSVPSRPLSLRNVDDSPALAPAPMPNQTDIPFDESIQPASPPRVTRSPLSGIMRPMLDDTNVPASSLLPSLELSPIRRTASASSDASNNTSERSAPQSDSTSIQTHDTPVKRRGIPPPSRDSTPKTTNKGSGQARSADALLAHPAIVVPKDLPKGKKKPAKPAGLPLSPTKSAMMTSKTIAATAGGATVGTEAGGQAGGQAGAVASSPSRRPPKSPASSPMRANGSPRTAVTTKSAVVGTEAGAGTPEKTSSTASTPDKGTNKSEGEHVLDVSNDSLLTWLAKSENDAVSSDDKGSGNLEKKESVSNKSAADAPNQSLDVISESEPNQNAGKTSADVVTSRASAATAQQQDAGDIGSFFSRIGSGLDNALEGMMEVVAEGVDKGYKEVNTMTTNFLDGPGASGQKHGQNKQQSRKQQQLQQQRRKMVPRSPSPGIGPIHVEISRSFIPNIIGPDESDETATLGSKSGVISALTYETYEDYASTVSLSPARRHRSTSSTPRGIQMAYSEDALSNNKNGAAAASAAAGSTGASTGAAAAAPAPDAAAATPEDNPSTERRFFT